MKTRKSAKENGLRAEIPDVISCRPDGELKALFWDTVADLGITSSELAKRAIAAGLGGVVAEIVKEREQGLKTMKNRLSQVNPTTMRLGCWQSPVLMPVS